MIGQHIATAIQTNVPDAIPKIQAKKAPTLK